MAMAKQSGFAVLQSQAKVKGLSARKACLFPDRQGWGYMLEDDQGKGIHWAHTLQQCQDWLKEYQG